MAMANTLAYKYYFNGKKHGTYTVMEYFPASHI
jgi:hypothetical protein